MQAVRLGVFALIVPALTSSVVHARLSGDPFGAYCIVQKVVTGQDEAQRSTVQIWGTCAVRTEGAIDSHGNSVDSSTPGAWLVSPLAPPRRGYLYYFATKAREDVAQKEWADLKALAGTGEVVAIGSQRSPSRLRWADEKPQSPDEYSTQTGLAKITSNSAYSKIVADLKKAADGK
jgi:hypothetical protein